MTVLLFATFEESWLRGQVEWQPLCVRCRCELADGVYEARCVCWGCFVEDVAGRGSATEGSGAEAPAA